MTRRMTTGGSLTLEARVDHILEPMAGQLFLSHLQLQTGGRRRGC